MTPTRPTPWAWMLPDRSTHLQLPAEPMFTLTPRQWGKSPMPTMRLVDETAHIPALPEQFLRPARQAGPFIFGEMGYGKATLGKRIPQWWIDRFAIEEATAPLFTRPGVTVTGEHDRRSYRVLGEVTKRLDPLDVFGVAG